MEKGQLQEHLYQRIGFWNKIVIVFTRMYKTTVRKLKEIELYVFYFVL